MHPVVRAHRTGGQQTLYPIGELDAVVADHFEVMVATALADDRLTGVVVDLSAVTFLDCAGIGALIAGRHAALRSAKAFDVVGANGLPRRVLELTGTLTRLRVTPPSRESPLLETPLARV
ncbi:STAS domain-containing protein [Actinoplanes sp. DH11]|uniref:STAS domain-containing protein n=1 Tax=Actinoplanes sp. DH11 TaxID=2857011 RepID=UPI001E3509B2|nr:STAS domain-containing protein [Actinoplanes sp. DH11]